MKPKSGKYITFLPDGTDALVSQKDQSVLDVAMREGLSVDHTCGGFGTCGTCRIFVREGLEKLPPRNEIEADIAADRGFQDFERLACQTEPLEGLVIERPVKGARNKD